MYRISVEKRKRDGTWEQTDIQFAEGYTMQAVAREGSTVHCVTAIRDVDRGHLPLMLCCGRELCRAVLLAFPRALFQLLTGFVRKGEAGWR